MKIKLILKCRHCSQLRLSEIAAEKWKCAKTGEAIKDPEGKISKTCRLWSGGEFVDYMEDMLNMKLDDDGMPKMKRKPSKWRQGL